MPIYLYDKKGIFYISLFPVPNKIYKKIQKYKNINIHNSVYLNYPNDCKTHILNTMVVPTRLGYIIIINKNTLELRHFSDFDVLKDYKIQNDELSFVVFYINNAIKIHSGKFDIRHSYKICSSCYSIYTMNIKTCDVCGVAVCSRCENKSNNKVCKDCEIELSTSTDDSSEGNELFDEILLMI
jgi:hypothetical protein